MNIVLHTSEGLVGATVQEVLAQWGGDGNIKGDILGVHVTFDKRVGLEIGKDEFGMSYMVSEGHRVPIYRSGSPLRQLVEILVGRFVVSVDTSSKPSDIVAIGDGVSKSSNIELDGLTPHQLFKVVNEKGYKLG